MTLYFLSPLKYQIAENNRLVISNEKASGVPEACGCDDSGDQDGHTFIGLPTFETWQKYQDNELQPQRKNARVFKSHEFLEKIADIWCLSYLWYPFKKIISLEFCKNFDGMGVWPNSNIIVLCWINTFYWGSLGGKIEKWRQYEQSAKQSQHKLRISWIYFTRYQWKLYGWGLLEFLAP